MLTIDILNECCQWDCPTILDMMLSNPKNHFQQNTSIYYGHSTWGSLPGDGALAHHFQRAIWMHMDVGSTGYTDTYTGDSDAMVMVMVNNRDQTLKLMMRMTVLVVIMIIIIMIMMIIKKMLILILMAASQILIY